MKTKVVVIHADEEPMDGIANPGPHQIYKNPQVRLEDRDLGDLHPEEVRVEMVYAGVCGTDVHLVSKNPGTGYISSSAPANIPPEGRIIGHEGVGKVVAAGSNVRHVKKGSYVTFESILVCHYCDKCREGRFNQCVKARLLGLERDGLFGTVVDVPSMLIHDVTQLSRSDKDLRAAACVEPAGVAYVACQNTQISPGNSVVVFGAGPIGLFCAILGKAVFGASQVHIVDPVEFRRDLARRWSDHVYDVDEFFEAGPHSVDVVIEASGCMDNINRVFRYLNANARIALLARSGTSLVLDAVDHMITNAISLVGSRGHLGGAFSKIISLYANGQIPLDQMVTEVVYGVEEFVSILKSPNRIIDKNCKVLVRF
jgi:threonine dehydrogenase-like Zn-dependent dehydrogenase